MSIVTRVKAWFGFAPAREDAKQETSKRSPLAALATLAVPFVFALCLAVQPAAAEINLSVITEVINAFIDIIDPIVNLVVAIVPLWFIMQILGFIMGLLAAILAMIRFNGR